MVLYLLAAVAGSAAVVAQPLLFRRIIDRAIPAGDTNEAVWLGITIGLVGMVGVVLGVTSRWLGARIGHGLVCDLRTALFEKLLWLPQGFYAHAQQGAVVSRLNADVTGAEKAFTLLLRVFASNSVLLVAVLVTMGTLDWRLAVAAVGLFPPLGYLTRHLGLRMQTASKEYLQRTAGMNARLNERTSLPGALLVHLFGQRDVEASDFGRDAAAVRDAGVRQIMVARLGLALVPMSAAAATAVIYALGARSAIAGGMSVGTLVAFGVLITRLYEPIFELADARIELSNSLVSFARVFELLDVPDIRPGSQGHSVDARRTSGDLEFDHVWFQYPPPDRVPASLRPADGDTPVREPIDVLRDVSFIAPGGQVTAIVGPTGAGKTTLLALASRLYPPTGGAVRLGGMDIAECSLTDLMAHVAVVSQDTHLFHASIKDNIRYARPGATDGEILAACRTAELAELVDRLPAGLDTVVGERGYRMSGGEKQRMAIARAVLKDPAVVLLDEATSHLDSATEKRVQLALGRSLAGRTVLVVAHRLSTVRSAAQIVVLAGGTVVETGRHEQLRRARGLYAELYLRQFAEDDPTV